MSVFRSSPISVLSILALAAAVQAASPAQVTPATEVSKAPATTSAAPAKSASATAAAGPASAPAAPAASAAAPASQVAPAVGKGTACEAVKAAISAKLTAKGVKAFTLDAVSAAEVKEAKVVGTCEGGAKKITYKRG